LQKNVFLVLVFIPCLLQAQLRWQNVDSLYQPLPASVHVYKSVDLLDGKPNIAYYVEADLKDKQLDFTADTTFQRRLTPSKFYEKNNEPLLVVNCTFFSFETNRNLNLVVKDGKMLSFNIPTVYNKKDSIYHYITRSAIGINKKRVADIAWLYTDTVASYPYSTLLGPSPRKGHNPDPALRDVSFTMPCFIGRKKKKWKMETVVGGGPALLSRGDIDITNEQEKMFTGKAIDDKHPRTAMGYTRDNKLIILVIEGRNPGIAEGATLTQEAQIFKDLGCWEALNLDGGGSSCMLVNGKETIKVSDKTGQRPVPAVFIINTK
jgi:Phosphodiester glycosidase